MAGRPGDLGEGAGELIDDRQIGGPGGPTQGVQIDGNDPDAPSPEGLRPVSVFQGYQTNIRQADAPPVDAGAVAGQSRQGRGGADPQHLGDPGGSEDGGAPGSGNGSTSSGCGCVVAGADHGSGPSGAAFGGLLLGIVALGRRRVGRSKNETA